MAAKGVARVGDTGSHGGTIITGASTISVNGRKIARVGDIYACPIHGNNPIISGARSFFGEGKLVAHVGSKTACGAVITSGSPNTFTDDSTSITDTSMAVFAEITETLGSDPLGGDPLSGGTLVAAAGNIVTGSTLTPEDKALDYLNTHTSSTPKNLCALYIHRALTAAGINLNTELNSSPSKESAYGYGPVLEAAGYRQLRPGEEVARGDIAVIQPPSDGHNPSGHVQMYTGNGEEWISDFKQETFYPGPSYRSCNATHVIYTRRPMP